MKKKATIEDYIMLGADLRLLKTLLAVISTRKNLLISEFGELSKICTLVNIMASEQENKMLQAYPDLSNEYLKVFFGATDKEPLDEVDKKIIENAKQTLRKCFKE